MMTSAQLAPVPTSAAEARQLVDLTLRDWGCEDLVDSARLIVTELFSNAVRHSGANDAIDLTIELHLGVVRISLGDVGRDGPVEVVTPDPTSERGRGLRLVEGLSDDWGVERCGHHKTVWAELRVPE